MKKLITRLSTLAILFSGITASFCQQTVSEEAKRHFDRGMAAVEMAKSFENYISAIKEFEQAAQLAPDWPDAYYNLGVVQEKAEKYRDALASLRRYLQLAPAANDADAVKTLINKLEYKAEQVLTPKDYADIFVSLNDSSWIKLGGKGTEPVFWAPPERVGENLVKVATIITPNSSDPSAEDHKTYEVIKIDGNKIGTHWVLNYACSNGRKYCPYQNEYEIEIISRNQVKVRAVQVDYRYSKTPMNYSYEYKRKESSPK